MDDFPALRDLYAGSQRPTANKRSRSGNGGGRGGSAARAADGSGPGGSRARVNSSLVMRVERVAATAQLWSLAPWSRVRRYDRVHVKGLTLRLRQVNGILNFSFLALNKKGQRGRAMNAGDNVDVAAATAAAAAAAPDGRRNSGFGGGRGAAGVGGWGAPGEGAGRGGGGIDDLDGIETDGEVDTDTTDEPDCPENEAGSTSGSGGETIVPTRRFSDTCGPYSSLAGSGPGFGGLRGSPPWGASSTVGSDARTTKTMSSRWGGGGAGSRSSRSISNSGTISRGVRSMSLSGRPKREPPSSGNVGNLGIVKVLGEAFMRRFNAYSEQVWGKMRYFALVLTRNRSVRKCSYCAVSWCFGLTLLFLFCVCVLFVLFCSCAGERGVRSRVRHQAGPQFKEGLAVEGEGVGGAKKCKKTLRSERNTSRRRVYLRGRRRVERPARRPRGGGFQPPVLPWG